MMSLLIPVNNSLDKITLSELCHSTFYQHLSLKQLLQMTISYVFI